MAFIDLVERKYVSEGAIYRPMDFARKCQYLTLDIIGDLAFGKDFGHLAQDRDVHEYISQTEGSMPVMMLVSVFPVLARVAQSKLLQRFMPSEDDPHGFGKFIGLVFTLFLYHNRSTNFFSHVTQGTCTEAPLRRQSR